MDINDGIIFWILLITSREVRCTHPECFIVQNLLEREAECRLRLAQSLSSSHNTHSGCPVEWDGVSCWPVAQVGDSVSVFCPEPLQTHHSPLAVPISRNCTQQGWGSLSVPYYTACYGEDNKEEEETEERREYFATVKRLYTVGYGVSLCSLCVAMLIFCVFRELLCTRTYIHLNLFSTFILRGVAVFVKDAVLFADETMDHCTVSTVSCKAAVTVFQYCVLSNFFWLLVEGLHLHTVLVFTFAQRRMFLWWYSLTGWGIPMVTIIIWTLLKSTYDNKGCWDDLDNGLWWIIKTPILLSVFVNLLQFVNIIRIIALKVKTPDSNASGAPVYSRLARSTLLLIPLFGVHYIVFALLPEHVGLEARLYFELVLGSFQGFIVALLYCFLNSEVQNEIRKQMRRYKSTSESNTFNLVTQDFTA